MGGFCVYGQSMEVARKRAEKKVSEFDPGTRRPLTPVEWKERVDAEAVGIFAQMKPVRVSGEFDAPQFARDFIDVALETAQCANMAVMRIEKKRDAKGNNVLSKTSGLPLMTWVRHE
ncbi:hypothetical protein ACFSHT_10240 [Paraburkholderia silviterrae]|uniref:Uncharacterized protein n=1 Tax=Paraburkholderia silviterrae TaxID=2528715 RepID=A0A4R5MFD2_9BURK|nr:hypothetical protein [Paraburkholderia silviterrae]TDG25337.1 hypothetical protein EYW47_05730 [Paraburkholderia silviterrae]